MYACETWAYSIKTERELTKKLTKNPVESFHIKILKQILGVHKKTTNLAVLAELARHPLLISIQIQVIKYFLRLKLGTVNPLLTSQYEEEKQTHNSTEKCLRSYTISLLDTHGLSYIWRNPVHLKEDNKITTKLAEILKIRLTDISIQTINDNLNNNSTKLTFLKGLKIDYKK